MEVISGRAQCRNAEYVRFGRCCRLIKLYARGPAKAGGPKLGNGRHVLWLVNQEADVGDLGVAEVRLGGGVLGLVLLAEKDRDGDGRQDTDDDDNYEKLDQGEALVVFVEGCALAGERCGAVRLLIIVFLRWVPVSRTFARMSPA